MLYIDKTESKIVKASECHLKELLMELEEKIDSSNKYFRKRLKRHVKPKLKDILIGEPKNILSLNQKIMIHFKTLRAKKEIAKVFNYNLFSVKRKKKYCAYNLAENINIKTCVYCNRLYTKTVSRTFNKITRPQFDHWFSKDEYPLLALSFYNLIPSCNICNCTLKNSKKVTLKNHLHPYVDKSIDMAFSYFPISYNTFKFRIKTKSIKAQNTVELFKLVDIYETHLDEIKDLVEIERRYTKSYLTNLLLILSGSGISRPHLYRLAFGSYLDESKFEKRPLSRMRRDILEELGII